ncbi:hypothetical protein ACFWSF_09490 [Streptomyces sp. NPDC058611]|uniref:hypothetical protein n=1 Tax=unclassified Streptomyces TaxID=2593676 RepID=UPI00364BBD49
MTTHLRLRLSGALALLLLTCTTAVWASPQAPAPAPTAGPCTHLIGPARDYCARLPATPATVSAPPAADDHVRAVLVSPGAVTRAAERIRASAGWRNGLLLFSTAAIAGAVGLILSAERRTR